MRTHTSNFKTNIKSLGRQLSVQVTYGQNTLGNEDINSVNLSYNGDILKSVMKQLKLDSNSDIALGTQISLSIGLLVGNSYEYINYGYFIVDKSEKQENTNSYLLTCYDKMLLSMVDYEDMNLTYPITIRNYLSAICTKLGLTFASSSDNFVNYDKEIDNELYLDSNGNSLDYTFRDVLDELAQVTASTICINDSGELEVRYINDTFDSNILDISGMGGTSNGVKRTVNTENGTITLKGTVTSNFVTRNTLFSLKQGKYKISANTSFTSNVNGNYVSLRINSTTSNVSGSITTYSEANKSSIFTNTEDRNVRFTIRFETNTVLNDVVLTPTLQPSPDTIDEEFLKNINVNFGEQYGPVNTITFSRSAGSDNISKSIPEDLADEDKIEIKISDNQILNGNNRDAFIDGILNKLYGLSYYINDYESTGILYYDLCDKYNVKVGNNIYSCIMLNDEINISNGLVENIFTEMPETSETDYKKTDKTDRKVNQTYLIVDKQNQQIQALASQVEEEDQKVASLTVTTDNIQANVTSTTNNLSNQISALASSTSLQINAINTQLEDGVEKLNNSLVTIDVNGIKTSRDDETFNTQITNKTFEVKDRDKTLLFAGYNSTTNKTEINAPELVSERATIGVHRCETITKNYKKRTAWFYVGGGN